MPTKTTRSLADELNEIAFAAPRKEDYLENDLKGAPLFTPRKRDRIIKAAETRCNERKGEKDGNRVSILKGPLQLEDETYEGEGIRRKDIFSSHDDTSESPTLDDAVDEDASLAETQSDKEEETSPDNGDLYEAYRHMQSDVGISDMKSRTVKDGERGRAVQRDRHLWKSCLELRVLLEKPLRASQQLPPRRQKRRLQQSTPQLTSTYNEVTGVVRNVLQELTELEDFRLLEKTEGKLGLVETDLDIEDLWERLEERYKVLRVFCNSSLDRFHRQAMLQSGATTGKGNLQILHQSISAQVQSLMDNPAKALARARMPAAASSKTVGVIGSDGIIPAEQAECLNDEKFEDTDFYQTLLNEYLVGRGKEPVPVQRARKRHRQGESQKKLRAMFSQVHEKLVNFMAPVESDPPAFAKQLFRNLFNQRSTHE